MVLLWAPKGINILKATDTQYWKANFEQRREKERKIKLVKGSLILS